MICENSFSCGRPKRDSLTARSRSDYLDIDPRYGTLEDWDNLLKGVHERGMKLMLALSPSLYILIRKLIAFLGWTLSQITALMRSVLLRILTQSLLSPSEYMVVLECRTYSTNGSKNRDQIDRIRNAIGTFGAHHATILPANASRPIIGRASSKVCITRF